MSWPSLVISSFDTDERHHRRIRTLGPHRSPVHEEGLVRLRVRCHVFQTHKDTPCREIAFFSNLPTWHFVCSFLEMSSSMAGGMQYNTTNQNEPANMVASTSTIVRIQTQEIDIARVIS